MAYLLDAHGSNVGRVVCYPEMFHGRSQSPLHKCDIVLVSTTVIHLICDNALYAVTVAYHAIILSCVGL